MVAGLRGWEALPVPEGLPDHREEAVQEDEDAHDELPDEVRDDRVLLLEPHAPDHPPDLGIVFLPQ